jgi:hypothetical protein
MSISLLQFPVIKTLPTLRQSALFIGSMSIGTKYVSKSNDGEDTAPVQRMFLSSNAKRLDHHQR